MDSNNNKVFTLKERFQNINILQYFGLLILLYVLISFMLNWHIISDELWAQGFGDQLSSDIIYKIINFKNKWDWLGFVILPIFLFVKVLVVAVCLEVGNFILDWKLQFKQLLRIVILAETVFLFVAFLRIIWFLLFPENLSLEYIQSFYPLSLINVIGTGNLPKYLIYPLQLINVFELIYWIVLAYLIGTYANKTFDKSLGFVAKTYGLGLFAWVVLVVFLSIN